MQNVVLEVETLSFDYPDGTRALKDISFQLRAGEKVALIGPNGSGKSTLLLHLNGVHQSPKGSIRINGISMNDESLGFIRAAVGLVFQDQDDQLFSPRVYDDVAFGPLHMGLPESDVRARVEQALASVGICDFSNRLSYHLSVGEKKRVALATVLSMEPNILVLDEPSAGLDPRGRRQLIDLLKTFEQKTMLVSTHDMRLAYELCARAIVLDEGQIVADDKATVVLMDAELMERHGLECP